MKVLLHICCGPCAIYTVERLRCLGNVVEGFFYNPNIYPASEYLKRKDAVEKLSQKLNFKIHFFKDNSFNPPLTDENRTPLKRCELCWSHRLNETALYAAKNGFEAFTTTLLISPYQDHRRLREIAQQTADRYEVTFVYEDFRIGFRLSHKDSKEMGLYHQNYCGCIYSKSKRRNTTGTITKEYPPSAQ